MSQAPGVSDVHIDRALTNVSVAYFVDASEYIADRVFPGLPVENRSNVFWKYSKSDWRRSAAKKRAPGTESAEIHWSRTTDNYFAEVYAAHVDIDDQTRANEDDDWSLDADASRLVTSHLLLQKDQLWCANFFKTGVWGTEYTGVDSAPSAMQILRWNVTGSDPLKDWTGIKAGFRLSTGKRMNFMVLGVDVWSSLENHAAILDRIKFTQKGVVTEDLVAEFFGIQDVYVAWASQSTGPDIPDALLQDAAASYSFIANSKGILAGYRPKSASRMEPSAGYTFNWKGYIPGGNRYGLSMANLRAPLIKSDRIEGEAAYVQKLVSADCGVWVNNAVD